MGEEEDPEFAKTRLQVFTRLTGEWSEEGLGPWLTVEKLGHVAKLIEGQASAPPLAGWPRIKARVLLSFLCVKKPSDDMLAGMAKVVKVALATSTPVEDQWVYIALKSVLQRLPTLLEGDATKEFHAAVDAMVDDSAAAIVADVGAKLADADVRHKFLNQWQPDAVPLQFAYLSPHLLPSLPLRQHTHFKVREEPPPASAKRVADVPATGPSKRQRPSETAPAPAPAAPAPAAPAPIAAPPSEAEAARLAYIDYVKQAPLLSDGERDKILAFLRSPSTASLPPGEPVVQQFVMDHITVDKKGVPAARAEVFEINFQTGNFRRLAKKIKKRKV